MLTISLFDAFADLAAILACAVAAAAFLCLPANRSDQPHEWTLQPGNRKPRK